MKLCKYSRSRLFLTLSKITLAKGHFSKTKSQVSVLRIIGPLVEIYNALK